jgi:DNA-binding CsgD family transcriptional regulator
MRKWNLAAVEQAFAAAAFDPNLWQAAMDCIAEQTESRGALILPMLGRPLPNIPISESLMRAAEIYFRDEWYQRDVRFHVNPETFRRVGAVDDFDCTAIETISSDPFYQDFLAPAGLQWFGGVALQTGEDLWCLSLNRGINQDPFSPEEKARLAQLSRSLSTAAATSRALGIAASTATLEAFDISQTAAVLLNPMGEVVRTNRSADRLLTGDVKIVSRRITSVDRNATSALDRALSRLLRSRAEASLMPPIPLRRAGQNPVLAYPLKLPSMSASALSPAQAAIILIDPGAQRRSPEVSLRSAFGLTPAESRLASHLGTGQSLETICEELEISKETGRNQLKSIFAKTGVHRQSEMVLLLSKML